MKDVLDLWVDVLTQAVESDVRSGLSPHQVISLLRKRTGFAIAGAVAEKLSQKLSQSC